MSQQRPEDQRLTTSRHDKRKEMVMHTLEVIEVQLVDRWGAHLIHKWHERNDG